MAGLWCKVEGGNLNGGDDSAASYLNSALLLPMSIPPISEIYDEINKFEFHWSPIIGTKLFIQI